MYLMSRSYLYTDIRICLQISNFTVDQVTYRNPKRTNWDSYKDDLKVNLETISRNICTINDVDQSVDQLQQAIISSFNRNCLARTTANQESVLVE